MLVSCGVLRAAVAMPHPAVVQSGVSDVGAADDEPPPVVFWDAGLFLSHKRAGMACASPVRLGGLFAVLEKPRSVLLEADVGCTAPRSGFAI